MAWQATGTLSGHMLVFGVVGLIITVDTPVTGVLHIVNACLTSILVVAVEFHLFGFAPRIR